LLGKLFVNRGHVCAGGLSVPLSRAAVAVLTGLKGTRKPDDHVFNSGDPQQALSNMSMAMVLRRMDLGHFTVDGFRSTFRDWAGDKTEFPREIVEHALAHTVGNEVERAYRRGDALEKRRELIKA
jgi:integrase